MFILLNQRLCLLWLWIATIALAQRDCDNDGATSTYSQSGLIVHFDNLCGKDIEAAVDFAASPEQRRSDCLDRCVKQAPLCYGFDYTPYVSSSKVNCWLKNGTFPATNATNRGFVADAAMLSPSFLAQLPQNCKTLGLRGCFEENGHLGSGTSDLATPTASPSSITTSDASITTSPTTVRNQQEATGGLSAGAKAGIGAGVGLVALIAILCGILFVLRRIKRKRAAADSNIPATEVQQGNQGDTYPPRKTESQVYAHVATSSPGLTTLSPAIPTSTAEQIHEIDGRTRHEK